MLTSARSPYQLGQIIREHRKARGWTQSDLAQMTGMRQALLSEIETGHEGAKLGSIMSLLAALELEIQVSSRHSGSAADIADIF